MPSSRLFSCWARALAMQEKTLLKTNGWGCLSGKVTLNGKIPEVVDLVGRMKKNADKECLAKEAGPRRSI